MWQEPYTYGRIDRKIVQNRVSPRLRSPVVTQIIPAALWQHTNEVSWDFRIGWIFRIGREFSEADTVCEKHSCRYKHLHSWLSYNIWTRTAVLRIQLLLRDLHPQGCILCIRYEQYSVAIRQQRRKLLRLPGSMKLRAAAIWWRLISKLSSAGNLIRLRAELHLRLALIRWGQTR